ncbi:MAG: hypothetical protein ACD_63C00060G0004 [uncultured bacterium]|nr:MAG: hypothetical protein ACD_63C00060G0004 [uncultured bacterium]
MSKNPRALKKHTYFVKGMHCPSCEILIERKLLEMPNIEFADASVSRDSVLVGYDGKKPTVGEINRFLKNGDYTFFEKSSEEKNGKRGKNLILIIGTVLVLILAFILLSKSGFASAISVDSESALPAFFVFGLLAGVSSCAALVGGLVLSVSKQWAELYSSKDSFWQRSKPHILFNVGRLASYALLGALLGFIGERLKLSLTFSSILVLVVSVVMLFLALQMFGIKFFNRFRLALPKFITKRISDKSSFRGKWAPIILGALTFFLPCGFTVTAQGLALISGSPIYGGAIMLLFALGTLPTLLVIGLSSVKFLQSHHWSAVFQKVAGILILFFVIFNINSQLNVLGFPSLSNVGASTSKSRDSVESKKSAAAKGLPQIVDGVQVVRTIATARGYEPNYLKVRAGIPVRWEIEDKGTSGCTNAVISKGLFDDEINLTPGEVSVKEFTPKKPGKYKFSCWMGMISGVIEVVDESGKAVGGATLSSNESEDEIKPSGASSCGGSGSCGCGGRR